jgi:hypothetical protein
MPVPKETQDALVREALEKEGIRASGKPEAAPGDRLPAVAAMLSSALTSARIALDLFMAEYQSGQKPQGKMTVDVESILRPRTFNQPPASQQNGTPAGPGTGDGPNTPPKASRAR